MKQKVTKQVIMLLVVVALSLARSSAAFFPITSLNKVNSACSVKSDMYLNQDNDADSIPDYYLYLRSNFRIPEQNPPTYHAVELSWNSNNPNNINSTRIYYYVSDTNVLSKRQWVTGTYTAIDNATFYKASWVFPYNQWVRGIDTNDISINFERPTTAWANNIVSIIYSYKYETAVGFRYTHPPTPTYWYNAVASWVDFHGLTPADYVNRSSSKERRWSPIQSTETCKNYIMHRCGDGTIDTWDATWMNVFTGETCDDGELNGTPGNCNLTCDGIWGWAERCGDEITQPAGTYYNWAPETPENMSFEDCDRGDLTGDTDGDMNGDNPELNLCTSICLNPFVEAFTEEFING